MDRAAKGMASEFLRRTAQQPKMVMLLLPLVLDTKSAPIV